MGWTGPRTTRALNPFPRSTPLNGLGRCVLFSIPYPCPPSGPCPTYTPDGLLLKIAGNKPGLPRERVRVGRGRGRGGNFQKNTPPAPCKGVACCVKARPAPSCNEHYLQAETNMDYRNECVDWFSFGGFGDRYASFFGAYIDFISYLIL